MIITPITKIAQGIWNALPGDDRDKMKLVGPVTTELRTIRRNAEIAHRQARVAKRLARPPRRTMRTVDAIVEQAIGRTMTQAQGLQVEIYGVNINLTTVFAITERPEHPMHTACVEFLATHRIALVAQPGAYKGIGKVPRIVARLEDGE